MSTAAKTDRATVLRRPQRRASDPAASAWVAANAGAGKTFVLTARVLRLLLAGTPPGRLLCLTFTKAAAAEMTNRVFRELERWATVPDADLDAALAALEDRAPTDAERRRARTLFADALETPGGLKIQTIHAFCETLLRRFSLEAGVSANFAVIEERERRDTLISCRDAVLFDAASGGNPTLEQAQRTLAARGTESRIDDLVDSVLAKKAAFDAWRAGHATLDAALEGLATALGLKPGETQESIAAEIIAAKGFPERAWPAAIADLKDGSVNDQKAATKLQSALAAPTVTEKAEAYLSLFTTAKLEMTANPAGTKAVQTAAPGIAAALAAEHAERIPPLLERWKAAQVFEASAALFRIAAAIIDAYRDTKARLGVLDYDDLIDKARALLTTAGQAAWVQYKLDGGIDHVLVDEAQDTSPAQWAIVKAIAEEFFSGEGARPVTRTLFVVGDEKQSIFSFQGADPVVFGEMRRMFEARIAAVAASFHAVPLNTSFRTVASVLSAVDQVFAVDAIRAGVTDLASGPIVHTAERGSEPGSVELWPMIIAEPEDKDRNHWTLPFDADPPLSPDRQSAAQIADVIHHWLVTGTPAGPGGEPIRAGDILILLRKRGPFADALLRALKARDIPVAGADRLRLLDHIAVMDLLALARFVLLPEDDLTLATLLKSPLCGLDDDDLIALLPQRTGSAFDALKASGDRRHQVVAERLSGWRARADTGTPHAFFASVLSGDGGRRAFRGRLGAEVDDVLDEFLSLALTYQTTHIPALQGFVAWLEGSEIEIKRDMEDAAGEVRLMTVHGAKGLEAKVVILADTNSAPGAQNRPAILILDDGKPAPPLVWPIKTAFHTQPIAAAIAAADAAADAEYRRLLYVAMTRARDRLVITGHAGASGRNEKGWYALVDRALTERMIPVADPYGLGFDILRLGEGAEGVSAARASDAEPVRVLPDWIGTVPPAEPAPPRLVAPSSAFEAAAGSPAGSDGSEPPDPLAPADAARALERGRLVHKLLETLPDIPASERGDRARRFLDRAGALDASECDRLLADVLALLDDPRLAPLFGPHARAEVPVTGRVQVGPDRDRTIVIAGIIDRLADLPDRVVIADFKTNRIIPATPADIPPAYLAQMAVYRAVIAALYPKKPVEAWLVFTAGPLVMTLPGAVLETALDGAAAGGPSTSPFGRSP